MTKFIDKSVPVLTEWPCDACRKMIDYIGPITLRDESGQLLPLCNDCQDKLTTNVIVADLK